MKSYLLHGENHPESRKKLSLLISQAETQGWEIVRLDGLGDKIDLNTISGTASMFGSGNFLVVENYFSNNKKAVQLVKELLDKPNPQTVFLFWESKTIAPQTLRSLAKYLQTEEFKIPKILFNFLDSFSPGNAKHSLMLLQKTLKENSPDMLVIMLSRQIRLLYCLLVDSKNLKLADWQKRNLEQQAKNFTPGQLLRIHNQLLELDRKNKRSQLPENLGASLDLLVASI
ncbi:MAG: hypothetical protein A3F61_03835 [Candidatus Blackburnbacteria bacterium RIFCSPHIGHO2_12_FULL_41_13b]|uniref:DNA-directed DNA polymerase n=1 Tax=Candidatus Blackburnbacteria bacterium RIFCSPHIGHO2_12_FULL_41_13b TaxID=1797517 RepID=A0A1G1V5S0_9BACT|nr:MAG: hypothetical protein A3F61_03835 [Candidatus Blackburnbacteria bacterium RIFCSPHIGHO2_12_FULL_41_13b]